MPWPLWWETETWRHKANRDLSALSCFGDSVCHSNRNKIRVPCQHVDPCKALLAVCHLLSSSSSQEGPSCISHSDVPTVFLGRAISLIWLNSLFWEERAVLLPLVAFHCCRQVVLIRLVKHLSLAEWRWQGTVFSCASNCWCWPWRSYRRGPSKLSAGRCLGHGLWCLHIMPLWEGHINVLLLGPQVLKFKREPRFSFFPYRFFLLRIGGRVLGTGCLGPSSEDLGASVQLFLQRPVLLSVSSFLLRRTSGPQNRLSGYFITLTTMLSCAGNQYQQRAQYWSLPSLEWNFTIVIKKALLCALHMDA